MSGHLLDKKRLDEAALYVLARAVKENIAYETYEDLAVNRQVVLEIDDICGHLLDCLDACLGAVERNDTATYHCIAKAVAASPKLSLAAAYHL